MMNMGFRHLERFQFSQAGLRQSVGDLGVKACLHDANVQGATVHIATCGA